MLELMQPNDLVLGPVLATFLLGLTTFVILLWYSSQKHSYWKKIGIPYVKPLPFVGSVVEAITKPLHDVELARYNKYGKIYGHYEGHRALLSVAEPEILRQVFVKDFHAFTGRRVLDSGDKVAEKMISIIRGEDWKRIRTIITPTFTTGKIKKMISIFKECSETLVKNFREVAEKKTPVDVKRIYGAFTMDIIASSAFSTKIDSHNDPYNPFVLAARNVFTRNVNWRFILFIISPGLMKLFRVRLFSPKAIDFFTDVTLQIIKERKRTGQTRNDFLQLLLDTANEAPDDGKTVVNEKDDITENYGSDGSHPIFKQNPYTKKSLSQDELIAQCVIFFLAGYDTTASTLAFASYLLALNPDLQEKLIKEVDDALRENKDEFTYEAIQTMKYLDNVISETLRLYPPGIRIERMADEDYKLGDTGLTIPKGMVLTVPVYAMHRDPKLYPDPEKFDPDRFTPEERSKRNPYTYLPFGQGPRNCVGMRFALMEVKVCLAYALSNLRFKRCPQTKVPLDFYLGQGVFQPKEITLEIETRTDKVKATDPD